MGFEVCYHYHEKIDGGYNKDELKTFKKKVGDPFEEVCMEKLAVAIMAQLARRDVWIVDVEVYELSKKKIAFKETKGGIVLKNKKFIFDSVGETTVIVEQEESDPAICKAQTAQSNVHPHNVTQPHNKVLNQSQISLNKRVVDSVVFSPEPQQLIEIKRKNIKLTPNKKYPVFKKSPSPTGMGEIYIISDDDNKEISVSDIYFIPGAINLLGDKELGFTTPESNEGGKLYWGDATSGMNVPKLR
jgi:hypothetical protein